MTRGLRELRRIETGGRFARHHLIEGWDQERLRRARIAVFGAGALGNEVLKNLALLGAGKLTIVDFDRVDPSNLTRSVLFRDPDCQRPKAEVAAERLQEIAPAIEVEAVARDLHLALGPGRLAGFDLAIACLDSIDARLGVDRLCRRAGLRWLNGGLGPSAAEITVYAPDAGPCHACTLTARALRRELTRWSCQDGARRLPSAPVMPTTATAAALGGALMAQEALAMLFAEWGGKSLAPGTRLLLTMSPYALVRFEVPRNPLCPQHDPGVPAEPVVSVASSRSATGTEILEELAISDPGAVEVHLGIDLVVARSCGCTRPYPACIPARELPVRCDRCGEPVRDVRTAASLPGDHPALELPLGLLGIPDGGELVIHDGRGGRTVRLAVESPEPTS